MTSLVTTTVTLSALLLLHLPLQHLLMKLNLVLLDIAVKDQFSGAGEDAALHLNNFVELCDMQKYKEVYCDNVKLKLFLSS